MVEIIWPLNLFPWSVSRTFSVWVSICLGSVSVNSEALPFLNFFKCTRMGSGFPDRTWIRHCPVLNMLSFCGKHSIRVIKTLLKVWYGMVWYGTVRLRVIEMSVCYCRCLVFLFFCRSWRTVLPAEWNVGYPIYWVIVLNRPNGSQPPDLIHERI